MSSMDKQHNEIMRDVLMHMTAGKNISEACAAVGIPRDGVFKYLRKKYPAFDEQVKELRWGPQRTASENNGAVAMVPEKEWGTDFNDARIKSFLMTYRKTHDKNSAARSSGFLPTTVEAMMDPTSKKFNAEFARAMREEEKREAWEIEDDLKRQARSGDTVSQRWWLERKMPEYGSRAKSGTDANDHKFNPETLKETAQAMRELIAEIRKGRAPEDSPPTKRPSPEIMN